MAEYARNIERVSNESWPHEITQAGHLADIFLKSSNALDLLCQKPPKTKLQIDLKSSGTSVKHWINIAFVSVFIQHFFEKCTFTKTRVLNSLS